jgi:hypothetical protein|tara:strand:- start:185 stop:409 length:225 start_codon:yes stop_codon:yes gene_type:complete
MTAYRVDEDTMRLLEETLNMAQTTVDAQYDSATADAMQVILQELADCFDIVITEVDENEVVPKPNFTVVKGGLE